MNVPFAVHIRRPARLAMLGIAAVAMACMALPTRANAQCAINGPENVADGAQFTLCAPTGYTYRWSGPGVSAGVTSRCITLSGRPSGLYEYTVALYSGGAFQDRCTQTVAVGDNPSSGTGRPEDQCTISGPSVIGSGETVQLCGPASSFDIHSYSWTGPGGYTGTTRCVSVSRPGDYTLTTRNQVTGHQRTCTQRVEMRGGDAGRGNGTGDCAISGPDSFEPGTRVRLCGPNGAYSYRWTGPGNITYTSSCITVTEQGTYTLNVMVTCTNARTTSTRPAVPTTPISRSPRTVRGITPSGRLCAAGLAPTSAQPSCDRSLASWTSAPRRSTGAALQMAFARPFGQRAR
jgi:hypothetical protein